MKKYQSRGALVEPFFLAGGWKSYCVFVYVVWFNCFLGLNFIFFCFKLIIIHYHTQNQTWAKKGSFPSIDTRKERIILPCTILLHWSVEQPNLSNLPAYELASIAALVLMCVLRRFIEAYGSWSRWIPLLVEERFCKLSCSNSYRAF